MKTHPSQIDSPPLKPMAEAFTQTGLAFRPTDRVNFDTVKFSVSGIEWDVTGQTRCLVSNGDGELVFSSTNRLPVSGKYGMHNLQVRYNPIAKTLCVEGSLFGFILGQNVITSQYLAKGLAFVIHALKKELGFTFAVPMRELIYEHVTLHRVDLAVNLQLESEPFVKTCLQQITRQLIEQDCAVWKVFTSVYWMPKKGREYSIIFYGKGAALRRQCLSMAKRASDEKQKFFEDLRDECDGLLRVEVRLRSAELKKQGLQNVKAWSGNAPKEIFNHYFSNVPVLNVVSSGLDPVEFEAMPRALRPVMALHKLNVPMELVYSPRSIARHRALSRERNIDLKCPAQEEVVLLTDVLTASRIKPTPPWLVDARFEPPSNKARKRRVLQEVAHRFA
ncbi:phage/plasmid replication domain-containing protein [Paraburkholderia tropica]|uniref:phage/plasmid replication domain-containing protein n=1 Tax=Paraburkholderia tropica TaxID=92647 RepID=UPI002AB6D213|nr:phage/plasmid replication protein [Paraburkholderia tropica]